MAPTVEIREPIFLYVDAAINVWAEYQNALGTHYREIRFDHTIPNVISQRLHSSVSIGSRTIIRFN